MRRLNRSLRRQLLLWLLLPQLVLWMAAIAVAYVVALRYVNIAIDHSLFQATRALARQVQPLDSGLLIDFPRAARQILEESPDDQVFYMASTPPGRFILGNRKLPEVPDFGPPQIDKPYYYDGVVDRHPVRIAALYLNYGTPRAPQLLLVQIAKGVRLREQLARDIFRGTVLPLSVLILLMSVLVNWGIRRGLAPLTDLRKQVENRDPRDLTPIELDRAPAEVRGLARALNSLLIAVRQMVETQRRFIADAAHQLRTPLAGLKSQTDLAQREKDPQALVQRLTQVQTSAARTIHLVNQLLTLARAEPDQDDTMQRMPVDLPRLVRELAAEMAPRALAVGIDLGCYADLPAQIISGNPVLLRELFVNLLENALRYCPSGSMVTVRIEVRGQILHVEVEDNGPGIADADKVRVFERFYRGTQMGTGCGLGMPIVREIAGRHRAQVELHDALPHGLLVVIEFPLEAD